MTGISTKSNPATTTSYPPLDLERRIRQNWYGIDNLLHRATICARLALHHGDAAVIAQVIGLIEGQLPYSREKEAILADLRRGIAAFEAEAAARAEKRAASLPPVESDPELLRIAIGLGEGAAYRLWCVFHAVNRAQGGVGHVERHEMRPLLAAFGIAIGKRHYNALIQRGNGVLWSVSRDGAVLHLRSYHKVAARLTARALADDPDLVRTNPPGQKFRTLDVAGSLADFEARALAMWLDYRQDYGLVNIAQETLAGLFGRTAATIRAWLRRAGVAAQANYTQYAGEDQRLIPSHATLYVTRHGAYRVSWRLSNSYRPPAFAERAHKYTPKRAYYACLKQVEESLSVHPAGVCGGDRSGDVPVSATADKRGDMLAGGGVKRTGRLFFHGGEGISKRRKGVRAHLRKHEDYHVAHHVYLGSKRGTGIYDCYDPDEMGSTGLRERDYRAQYQARRQAVFEGFKVYVRA